MRAYMTIPPIADAEIPEQAGDSMLPSPLVGEGA